MRWKKDNFYGFKCKQPSAVVGTASFFEYRSANGDIRFNASGTTYTFWVNGQFNQMTSTTTRWGQTVTTYIRQTGDTSVTIENNSNNSDWSFYPIVAELP